MKQNAEENEKKREHDMKMERMRLDHELEIAKLKQPEHKPNSNDNITTSKAKSPRLPTFIDGKDDIDSYLERFERYAKKQQWKQEDWAIFLSTLLTGKALDVYTRMPKEETDNYDKVKEALLKRYQLTEEGFQMKFRDSKPEYGESPEQYITRIGNYLTRWMKLAKVKEDCNGLRQLIIMEQFNNMCPKNFLFI